MTRSSAPASVVLATTVVLTLVAITACSGSRAAATRPAKDAHAGPRVSITTASTARTKPSLGTTTTRPATTRVPETVVTPPRPTGNGLTATRLDTGAWFVAIDAKLVRFNLMPGSVEPKGTFIRPSSITPELRPSVIAAFNGGFKFKDSHGGFSLGGVTPVPLVDGSASLVVFEDGTATVGQWNRDVRMSSRVQAVLQNLHLMVDHGVATDVSDSDAHKWGSTFPKETVARVPRSGVCVTADGSMRWVGGPSLGAATLADTMIRAGCQRGMELDINPKWVSFAIYDHLDPAQPGVVAGHNLYDGMHFPPTTYLVGKDRNWLMLTTR